MQHIRGSEPRTIKLSIHHTEPPRLAIIVQLTVDDSEGSFQSLHEREDTVHHWRKNSVTDYCKRQMETVTSAFKQRLHVE